MLLIETAISKLRGELTFSVIPTPHKTALADGHECPPNFKASLSLQLWRALAGDYIPRTLLTGAASDLTGL